MRYAALALATVLAGCAPEDTTTAAVRSHEARMDARWRDFDQWFAAQMAAIRERIPSYLALCEATTPARGAPAARRPVITACAQEKMNADLQRINAESERRMNAIERVNDQWLASMREIERDRRAITAPGTAGNPIYIRPVR